MTTLSPPCIAALPALSIRAPWWWFMLHCGKDIENRDWSTNYRGAFLIHASKWFGSAAIYEDALEARHIAASNGITEPRVSLDQLRASGGCIVGRGEIADCVTSSDSRWFFGRYGFVVRNAVAFAEPIPCKGALGFFRPKLAA